MKIGVDIDGVLIDFEERLRYKAAIFDYTERKNTLSKSNDCYWVQDKINEYKIEFDKYYWRCPNKLENCLNENIDIMIDDNPNTCENLSKHGVKTFYFRNIYGIQLKENQNLIEVHDWGEIYRNIKELNLEKRDISN